MLYIYQCNHTYVCKGEVLLQALFNYFSCSAVAIATVVGGSNTALVTALMIAAHMVQCMLTPAPACLFVSTDWHLISPQAFLTAILLWQD